MFSKKWTSLFALATVVLSACAPTVVEKPVVETVIVEKEKVVEKPVVQTVVVEKEVVETVVVEKPVVMMVVVEKEVTVEKKIVETVVVEKEVLVTVVVEKEKVVERRVVETVVVEKEVPIPPPAATPEPPVVSIGSIVVSLKDLNGNPWDGSLKPLELRIRRGVGEEPSEKIKLEKVDTFYTTEAGRLEIELWADPKSRFWEKYWLKTDNRPVLWLETGETRWVEFVLGKIEEEPISTPRPSPRPPTPTPTPTRLPPPRPSTPTPTPR